jgi:hypothetical protein
MHQAWREAFGSAPQVDFPSIRPDKLDADGFAFVCLAFEKQAPVGHLPFVCK